MFITDDKLPDDVVRRRYAETKHALCCLNCGFEHGFNPTQPGSIGKPLWALLEHECRSAESCGRYYKGVFRFSALHLRVLAKGWRTALVEDFRLKISGT